MTFGFGVLRHRPRDFWQLMPRELQSAYAGLYGETAAALERTAFAQLMNEFPDQMETTDGGRP